MQKQVEDPQEYLQHEVNQPPIELPLPQQPIVKTQYKYLRASQKIKTGFFGQEFDLRFDQIRGTMITKGLMAVAFEFYPEMKKYKKQHPNQTNQPENKHKEELQKQLPMVKPIFDIVSQNSIRYTWIGHSTALIQIGSDNFIIDPVFSSRASPIQLVGPKRFRPPACQISQLPKINAVLISHDHYDHLDTDALNKLQKHSLPLFIAGLDSGDVLPKSCRRVEMDWMGTFTQSIEGRQYKITFVPVCHWSKRGMNQLNTRLWGGFVIQTPFKQKIFYSGDTAYCGVFKEIGDKFGPFDLSILPIGAYQPRHILKPQHVNPEEAVLIHQDLKSKQSVGVHWGTFPLGAQGYFQAKYDLIQACKKHKLGENEFITISHGDSAVFEKGKPFKK